MKFSEMPYSRPDLDEIKSKLEELITAVTSAADFAAADAAFLACDNLMQDIDTLYSIAYVRHEINTEDEFYSGEVDFFDENLPLLQEVSNRFDIALLSSAFRPQFEEKYGSLMFTNTEISLKAFSPDIIPELQEENRLTTEYGKLIASAQIPFKDGVYTIAQLYPFKESPDDETRHAAWRAEAGFYTENSQRLDSIYAKLVELRDKMGKKLGYSDYRELGYYRMMRNCYREEDVKRFREAVIKYIVPIADSLYRAQAERTGLPYPLSYSDVPLSFRSGKARPCGTSDDILDCGKKFYHELSPQTAEFIDFMYDNELLDVLSRKGKSGGGFCTSFPRYKSPFIFANFNGTSGDVDVMTHEAGHAFAAYTSRDIVPSSASNPTMEACEVHSTSMEYLAWPWAEGFFGRDTEKYKYSHLASALTFLPYGTMVDHFQHIMYEKPELSSEERHDVWKDLMSVYMPWIRLGDIPFYGDGRAWQRQAHIYENPFYYIDYCLAYTAALQIWAISQSSHAEAWEKYYSFVCMAGKKTFTGLLESAGLETPFGDGALARIADVARKHLESIDASAF